MGGMAGGETKQTAYTWGSSGLVLSFVRPRIRIVCIISLSRLACLFNVFWLKIISVHIERTSLLIKLQVCCKPIYLVKQKWTKITPDLPFLGHNVSLPSSLAHCPIL